MDPSASSASYTQNSDALFFGPVVSLGDTVGGRIIPFVIDPSAANTLGIVMQRTGANPGLPFTLELFDANLGLIARYNGQTIGVDSLPVSVPVSISGTATPGERSVAGMQFTWDGGGGISVAVLSLVFDPLPGPSPSPTPEPSPTPGPSPTPQPTPQPPPSPGVSPTPTPPLPPKPTPVPSPSPAVSPTPQPTPTPTPSPTPLPSPRPYPSTVDRYPPSVNITSSKSSRKRDYTLTVTVSDDVKPHRLRYRKKAPRKKKFGDWIYTSLPDRGKIQTWGQTTKLRRKGKWRIEVQAFDYLNRASSVGKITVKRK